MNSWLKPGLGLDNFSFLPLSLFLSFSLSFPLFRRCSDLCFWFSAFKIPKPTYCSHFIVHGRVGHLARACLIKRNSRVSDFLTHGLASLCARPCNVARPSTRACTWACLTVEFWFFDSFALLWLVSYKTPLTHVNSLQNSIYRERVLQFSPP